MECPLCGRQGARTASCGRTALVLVRSRPLHRRSSVAGAVDRGRRHCTSRACASTCRGAALSFWKGDFVAATPLLAESLALCRDADEPAWAAFAQCGLGAAATGRGEYGLARSQLQDGLAAARRIDDRWVTAFALHFLAQCATDTGGGRARGFAARGMHALVGSTGRQ